MANIIKSMFKKDKLERMKEGIIAETGRTDAKGDAKEGTNAELLSARVMALDEARKATGERFLTVAEQIGDLRAEHRSLEGNLRELSLKATKAVDLVASVQPEALSTRIKQQDAQIKAVNARLDQTKDFHEEVMKELKSIRTQVSLFRGIEQTVKLNKDAQEKLVTIEKIDHGVKVQADKVADMFAAVKKDFEKMSQVESLAKGTRKDMDSAITAVNSMHARVQNILTKDDLKGLTAAQEKMEEELLTELNKAKEDVAHCYAVVEKADKIERSSALVERTVTKAQSINAKQEKAIAALRKRLDASDKRGSAQERLIAAQSKTLEQQVKLIAKQEKALKALQKQQETTNRELKRLRRK